jgi:hypothetical protein
MPVASLWWWWWEQGGVCVRDSSLGCRATAATRAKPYLSLARPGLSRRRLRFHCRTCQQEGEEEEEEQERGGVEERSVCASSGGVCGFCLAAVRVLVAVVDIVVGAQT